MASVLAVPATLLAAWLPGAAAAAPVISAADDLQARVDAIVAAGAPGAALVLQDGSAYEAVSSGLANVVAGRELQTGDAFRAGSVTKTFVATLALQLVETGELDLDAVVADYLPNLLPDGDVITVRQLLNHTSGLFNYNEDENFGAALLAGEAFTPRELVAYSTSHPLVFAPGTGWAYSNTNYIVLGMIIRETGDKPIRNQIEQRIAAPLGLSRTGFPVYSKRIPGAHASGYVGQVDSGLFNVTTALSPSWAWAAGSLISTAPDLAEFYRSLLGGELVAPDLLEEMKTTVPIDEVYGYGLGLFEVDLGCGTAWGHDGLFFGYYDMVVSSEDGTRQVSLMMNVDPLNGVPPPDVTVAFSDALVDAFCADDVGGSLDSVVLPELSSPAID